MPVKSKAFAVGPKWTDCKAERALSKASSGTRSTSCGAARAADVTRPRPRPGSSQTRRLGCAQMPLTAAAAAVASTSPLPWLPLGTAGGCAQSWSNSAWTAPSTVGRPRSRRVRCAARRARRLEQGLKRRKAARASASEAGEGGQKQSSRSVRTSTCRASTTDSAALTGFPTSSSTVAATSSGPCLTSSASSASSASTEISLQIFRSPRARLFSSWRGSGT
mmetsp:Transcript_23475/g.51920  ORF Transcript_23475/g.51920 Transcript_23475/m.51920 type:complete len:221 (+) Transcript_23475:1149-1811(+)